MDTYRIFIIHDMDRTARQPPTVTLPRGFRFLCQPLTQVRLGTCLSSPPQQHPQRDPDTASHLLEGGTKGSALHHSHTGDSSWGIVMWEHSWVLPLGQPDMAGLI